MVHGVLISKVRGLGFIANKNPTDSNATIMWFGAKRFPTSYLAQQLNCTNEESEERVTFLRPHIKQMA